MSASLFRDSVLRAQRGDRLGSIRLQAPRLGWIFFGIGLLTVAAIFTLLLFGHYTRHERAVGTLVPSSGLLTLKPSHAGTVTRVYVQEGDDVHAGQPLIEVSSEQNSALLGDTDAVIAEQLQIKRDRLKHDLDEQQRLADLQANDLRTRIALLHGQALQLQRQIDLQRQRASSAMTLYSQWAKASKTGVVSKMELLQQRDTALQNQVQLKQLEGQGFELRQREEQLRGQLNQLPGNVSAKRNETERQLADVDQSIATNAAHRTLLLRAPTDGIVTSVLVHPGQTVTSEESALAVLPSSAKLIAELWVQSKSVGFIRAGEPVLIRYQAFPYQKFGQHSGTVLGVSRTAMSATEVSRLLGQDINGPRYRVKVAINNQSVVAYGKREPLRPGMELQASILLDQRRLIEWVVEPLSSLKYELSTRTKMPKTEAL